MDGGSGICSILRAGRSSTSLSLSLSLSLELELSLSLELSLELSLSVSVSVSLELELSLSLSLSEQRSMTFRWSRCAPGAWSLEGRGITSSSCGWAWWLGESSSNGMWSR